MPTALFPTDNWFSRRDSKLLLKLTTLKCCLSLSESHFYKVQSFQVNQCTLYHRSVWKTKEAGLSSTFMPTLPPLYATFTKCSAAFKSFKWARSMPTKLDWPLLYLCFPQLFWSQDFIWSWLFPKMALILHLSLYSHHLQSDFVIPPIKKWSLLLTPWIRAGLETYIATEMTICKSKPREVVHPFTHPWNPPSTMRMSFCKMKDGIEQG